MVPYPYSKFQKDWLIENADIVVLMPAIDFLELTCLDNEEMRDVIEEAKSIDFYKNKSMSSEPIFLGIEDKGSYLQAFNHEGRHRTAALLKKDFDALVNVALFFENGLTKIPDEIFNQDFGDSGLEFESVETKDWQKLEML